MQRREQSTAVGLEVVFDSALLTRSPNASR
jgi:hypothetical protein